MSRFSCSIVTITLLLVGAFGAKAEVLSNSGILGEGDLVSQNQSQATAKAREEQKKETLSWLRPDRYDLEFNPIKESSEKFWREILWAIALEEPQDPKIKDTLNQILTLSEAGSQERIVKRAFQVATGIYLAEDKPAVILKNRFWQVIETSKDPRWVAMALSALVTKEPNVPETMIWMNTVRQRFPNTQNILLETTLKALQFQIERKVMPPLKDLLNWQIARNQAQLYVLCRTDRHVLCLSVLKDRDGRFVYQGKDLWSVPLLTRSLHGLSWQFQYGQSPAGIYRIEGTMPRSGSQYFRAYGQFPLVKVFLPSEDGVSHNGALPSRLNDYQSLLPSTWRGYFPMEETFWAGKLGRGLIRIHGTGEGVDFFASAGRFPASYGWNPALGCLSAAEVYDEDGRLIKADLPKILRAISQSSASGRIEGYMVLVEIEGDSHKPVTVEEIQSLIQGATIEGSQTIKVEPAP